MEPQINQSESALAPLKKVTPLSKYLVMALFVAMPFIGGWIGYTYAPENVVEVERVAEKGTTTPTQTHNTTYPPGYISEPSLQKDAIVKNILNGVSDYIFAVEESKIRGPGRSFPVLALYKKVNNQEPIKFATVGAVNEYPLSFALSPDKKKLAVNLESKLILVDIATGETETLFLAKYQIGGKIAFSKDGGRIAFIDGSQYKVGPPPDYKYIYTVHTIDLQTKELKTLAQNETFTYQDVLSWQANDRLVLSVTVAKGCAQPQHGLFNITTNSLEEETSLYEGGMYDKDIKIQLLNSVVPSSCSNLDSMCAEMAYTYYQKRIFFDSINNINLNDIGEIGKYLDTSIISPDSSSVLYSLYDLPTEALQCEHPILFGYFLKDFVTGEIKTVDNLGDQLAKWGIVLTDYSDKRIFISPVYKIDSSFE